MSKTIGKNDKLIKKITIMVRNKARWLLCLTKNVNNFIITSNRIGLKKWNIKKKANKKITYWTERDRTS